MQQFEFSDSGLKKRQRFIWILLFASEPCIFLLMIFTTEIKLVILLIAFVISTVMILTIVAVQMSLMKKTMRAMKVLVEEDRIVKRHSGGEQSLAWGDIVGVEVKENTRGDCIGIRISGKDKGTVHLWEFERMKEIAELIHRNVSDDVAFTTSRSKSYRESPIWYILGTAVALAAIALGRLCDARINDTFEFAISAGAALYLLVNRPMTKYNAGWKRYEILCGIAMTLIAIRMLIKMFASG